ncbi:unnamed protein product [Brugia pahangi]|uniref:Apple domain-containing protein n=1 Tax=Brugia pahangi TaxID=6280 RepID=A0A0N4TR02_BRUPA|nr:unnamed protein product [Brugia pahangi]
MYRFNHRQGLPQYSQHCQLYQADQLQHGESFFEADDRYSFYWEYCVQSNKSCSGDYAFTYLSDRYMDLREVREVMRTKTLEDCLSACLDAVNYACRSVSYNRTDGDCFLSQHNQLSKPALIKINNNPNYRIDYYENSCTNIADSFTFDYECKDDGIEVKVISKYPYTGAMYGLYDFFTCRIEPKNNTNFEYFFPSPTISKNCSDSIRYKGKDMVLEIVISTDGVEPLYFITPDDLTYQARCPLNEAKRLDQSTDHHSTLKNDATVDNLKMIASAHTLFSMLANATKQRHLSSINKNLSLKYAITNNHMNNFIDNNTLHSINSTITDINSTSTIKLLVLTATTITTTALSSSTTTTTTTTTTITTNITPITTTITITSNTTTTVPAATTANDDMTTTIEAVKSKFDSKTDKYDENINTAASDSISSTNSEFEMYNLATNKITPRILDATATRRNAMYPEATSIHSMISSSSEIFSKTKMLDKMMFTTITATTVTTITITTTATTIQKENIYNNDVTLNEIERKYFMN